MCCSSKIHLNSIYIRILIGWLNEFKIYSILFFICFIVIYLTFYLDLNQIYYYSTFNLKNRNTIAHVYQTHVKMEKIKPTSQLLIKLCNHKFHLQILYTSVACLRDYCQSNIKYDIIMVKTIDVESGYNEEEESSEPSQRCISPWCCLISIAVILVLVSISVGICFGVIGLPPNENAKTPTTDPLSSPFSGSASTTSHEPSPTTASTPTTSSPTTSLPTSLPTQKTATIKSTRAKSKTDYVNETYQWLADENTEYWKKGMFPNMHIGIFVGQVTQRNMFSICNRINRPSRNDEYSAALFYRDLEKSDKEILQVQMITDFTIRRYSDKIFVGGDGKLLPATKRLLWSGWAYEWQQENENWITRNKESNPLDLDIINSRFCNRDWKTEFDNLTRTLDKKQMIYVVKDFGEADPNYICWQLYTTEKLLETTNEELEDLAVVCLLTSLFF